MANATKTWTIPRKFKEIEEMHKKLIKKIPNMPYLPAKSFFSLGSDDEDKRKDDLEKYLNVTIIIPERKFIILLGFGFKKRYAK